MKHLARCTLTILLLTVPACGKDAPTDTTPDAGDPADAAAPAPDASRNDAEHNGEDATQPQDAAAPDPDAAHEPDVPLGPLDPTQYCETTVQMFCEYYLRCDRIAAVDMADCEANFLQTCNAGFEPFYVAYANGGELELSREGVAQCAAHLETVACERQINDLDGGCANMWVGQVPTEGDCGIGIENLICAPGNACVVDTSFCGVCTPAGDVGEPCVEDRCVSSATCVDGTCVARGLPGDSCDDDAPCAIGIICTDGTCQPRTYVGVGDACGATARCPYQTTCLGGVCVQDALLGGDCTASACASGWCDGTVCREFIPIGEGCGEGFQCASYRCTNGVCQSPRSACLTP